MVEVRKQGAGVRRGILLGLTALAAWMALPAAAQAATTCTWKSSNGMMDVNMSANDDFASFIVSGGAIVLYGQPAPNTIIACPDLSGSMSPTSANVDAIHVTDGSGATTGVVITDPATFAPGLGGGTINNPGEIKFDISFDNAGSDYVSLYGSSGDDSYKAGTSGIDFNAGSEVANQDADITISGTGFFQLVSILQGGNDSFSGQGVKLGDPPFLHPTMIQGGDGNNRLTGGANTDSLSGGADDDQLDGAGGTNSLSGGGGNDQLASGPVSDSLNGGAGTDTVTYANAPSPVFVNLAVLDGVPQPTGGAGTDTLTGIENLTGSGFDDTLTGDEQDNALTGGAGVDTANYGGAAAAVNVNLANTAAQNTLGAGTDTLSQFENAVGSPYADSLTGNSAGNVLQGGDGNDTLNGGAGDDEFNGGNDTDTVSYAGAPAGVKVSLSAGSGVPQNTGGAGTDYLDGNEENLTGSSFGDSLKGDLGVNVLSSGSGNDSLDGGYGGNDVYNGSGGTDTVSFAGCGDLTCDGILASLTSGKATDTIGSPLGTLTSVESLVGTHYADKLTGNSSANTLSGGAGNDLLSGGGGNDRLYGGDGLDKLLGSSGNDFLRGGNSSDQLFGDSGNDKLYGDAGDDRLTGGTGKDWLYGLSGLDKLFAKDGKKDKRIDCGSGANSHESAKYDKHHKDPLPKSC